MKLKTKFKRIGAMVLAVMMLLGGLTIATAEEGAEESVIPDALPQPADGQELPDENVPCADEEIAETVIPEETPRESEYAVTVVESEEASPSETETAASEPDEEQSVQEPISEESQQEADEATSVPDIPEVEPEDLSSLNLRQTIDRDGYAYARSVGSEPVFADHAMTELLFVTDDAPNVWLVTAYTEKNEMTVYGMDENGSVICGHIRETALENTPLTDADVAHYANDAPCGVRDTDAGKRLLFVIAGDWQDKEELDESAPKEEQTVWEESPLPSEPETEPSAPVTDEPASATEDVPSAEPTVPIAEDKPVEETVSEQPLEEAETVDAEAVTEGDSAEEPVQEESIPEVRTPQIGDYVSVMTATRVFSDVDETAFSDGFPQLLQGSFVKDAVVRIDSMEEDESGHLWYRVMYQYGDVLRNGSPSWSSTGSVYVLAEETAETDATALTMTDYAYTKEQQRLRKSNSGRKLMAASPMSGFSLKNISVGVGSFASGQTGLYGSSGKDSDYPQLAKSAAHGTIYATPHYLSGYTVFCLEHTYDAPGAGSGKNMTPTGPYTLLDMNEYCNTVAGIGVSGSRFKESTMHAVAWVLRHTYPFMVLDRSDSNNNTWSRAAGQFAIREVIKQLEGSQYVRDYWNMSDFYAFSGGAPDVYLTYARWLASNGIAHASVTGNISVGNKSVSISGGSYIGNATLYTDADLIRIPNWVAGLTGNSAGWDDRYYYARSGDTISVPSAQSTFSIPIESVSAADEEAGFLVGVPSASIQKVLVPVTSRPYAIKSQSVDFELTYGSITVTKKANDGTLLKGAVFELLNDTGVIATAETDADGKASFASVAPGTYTLREKTAPQGFKIGNAASQSVSVAAGVTTTASFTDPPIEKKIRICKTDSVTGKGLPGATFTVTRLSGPDSFNVTNIGSVVATITTNAYGIAETGLLPYGEYRITETGVPDDYLDSGFTTTQWIK